jgi:FMN-dependent NADH-azoreductase
MIKILHVISSPRGSESNSIKLGTAIVEKINNSNSDVNVKVKDLTLKPFPHLEEAHLNAFFTLEENYTEADKEAIKLSNEAIAEIFEADILVIGAPMYNFTISSTLKAWIDHIARAGITFKYTEGGPVGLIKGKKVYLAVTTGGIYSSGEYQSLDFVASYLKVILGFLGVTDITLVRAEGFAISGIAETALPLAIANIVI